MAKYDQYYPDYKKRYPGIEISPEVLAVLKKSDRKMKYIEVDLKTTRFIHSQKEKTTAVLPSREDSYDRLLEEHQQFVYAEAPPEDALMHSVELGSLYNALEHLPCEEYRLIRLRDWCGSTQEETALKLGLTQQAVSYRERRILQKLKKPWKSKNSFCGPPRCGLV